MTAAHGQAESLVMEILRRTGLLPVMASPANLRAGLHPSQDRLKAVLGYRSGRTIIASSRSSFSAS
jgi:hypothetical protein